MTRHVRLVYPHQLFEAHLEAPDGTTFVLVEDDLFFRQYAFHVQKLVLHRASMRRFADRLRAASYDVEVVETDGRSRSDTRLEELLRGLSPERVTVYDVVDDWLSQRCSAVLDAVGCGLGADDVLETPNFLTSREQVRDWFGEHPARMQHFYSWQRQRLGVLVEGADGDQPVGGRWSFDPENRKKLPKGHPVPDAPWPEQPPEVTEAVAWVQEKFPDNPGDATTFHWPTSHEEASAAYDAFLADRFDQFGPYEDAIVADQPFLFHSVITPGLNVGLLDPRDVLSRALDASDGVDLPSLEGFVRQVIGWREYMRATYVQYGRRMRSGNRLRHTRALDKGWWTAEVGLPPVDRVIERVLEHGWCHHIERLMVLGNAMCLVRTDPEAVYEWFMEMFVDAYDWVMVPNVYAMSQFAAGEAITTKPYVSGSNYLKKMSDFGSGDWTADWDGLYWTFVRDHREVFEKNHRSAFMVKQYDGMDTAKKSAHTKAANRWL